MARFLRVRLAVTVVAGLVLAGCSHTSTGSDLQSSGPGSSGSVPTARPGGSTGGTASLEVAGHTVRLTVQRCIQSAGHGVNVTAVVPNTHDTLTVDMADPVSASVLVYTTVEPDNSFTNYALATTVTRTKLSGGVRGTSVKLSGGGLVQRYDAKGRSAGAASHQQISFVAACSTIQPMQAAAAPMTSTAPKHPVTSTSTSTSTSRSARTK